MKLTKTTCVACFFNYTDRSLVVPSASSDNDDRNYYRVPIEIYNPASPPLFHTHEIIIGFNHRTRASFSLASCARIFFALARQKSGQMFIQTRDVRVVRVILSQLLCSNSHMRMITVFEPPTLRQLKVCKIFHRSIYLYIYITWTTFLLFSVFSPFIYDTVQYHLVIKFN